MENNFEGNNFGAVKAHNVSAILLTLLFEEHVSRIQLARKTSLSATTITHLVAELIARGVVVEEGLEEANGRRRVGRPRTDLSLVYGSRFAVGLHIGIGVFRVAVADLHAMIIADRLSNFDIHDPASTVLEQMAEEVEQVIVQSGVDRGRILGLGVGASGLVDYRAGVNMLAPSLGWTNVPVRDILQQRLKLPVEVDNNVRNMALGEAFFGAGRQVKSLVFVYSRTGVGSGIVVKNRVFHGSNAGAGEIGHITMIQEGGDMCRCGKTGCLETLISETVLVKEAQSIIKSEPYGILASKMAQAGSGRTAVELIFEAARAGDVRTRSMIEMRARYLGVALATVVNLIDPELILLGGMLVQGQDIILPVAEKTMRETAFARLGDAVRLEPTSFGWRAGVVGAASLALTHFFYLTHEEN
jgi:glucokinase-like ROK family protein